MLLRHARASSVLLLAVMLAVMLAVAPSTPAAAAPFSDTSGSSFEAAVTSLVDAGVVNGCADGRFCPREALTRAQLATVLVAALDLPEAETSPFTDVGDSVHADSIDRLAAAGITQGCAADRFCPRDTITRSQLASMLTASFAIDPTAVVFFDDAGATHGEAINALAAGGITGGCGKPLTAFCSGEPVQRAHAAVFIARAMDLIERVEISSLEQRRAQQAEIDAEEQRRREAARQAEAEAQAEAQAQAQADAAAARLAIWDALAQCESNGNWSINTGNGYYGGLQFSLSSWRWVGGSGYPHRATKSEQIVRGERLLSLQGWRAWPACSLRLGYR